MKCLIQYTFLSFFFSYLLSRNAFETKNYDLVEQPFCGASKNFADELDCEIP